jgi:hypothetical protein
VQINTLQKLVTVHALVVGPKEGEVPFTVGLDTVNRVVSSDEGNVRRVHQKSLEPISKSPEQDDEASELNEAEEILGIVLPAHQDTTLPLYPGKEALYQPAPCVSPHSAAVLRRLLHTRLER